MTEHQQVQKLKHELHKICEQIWPWDDWMGRRMMYKTLRAITGKKHISDMNYDQLVLARREMHRRLQKEKDNAKIWN